MAKEAKSTTGSKRMVEIDFTGVESGGGFGTKVPEGDYCFKITKVIKKNSENSGSDYLLFDLKLTKGNSKGVNKTIKHTCSLKKAALWNLRNLLEAVGKTVPSKSVKLDLDKMINAEAAATVVDDEYEGKKKSVVGAFFPLSEFVEDEVKKKSSDEEENAEEGGEEEESSEESASEDDAEDLFN